MKKNLGLSVLMLLTGLVVTLNVYSQDSVQVDSLNRAISTVDTDYQINKVFDQLGKKFEKMQKPQAIAAAGKSLQKAQQSGQPLKEVFAFRNLAQLYDSYGDKEEALKYFQQSVSIAESNKDKPFGIAVSLLHFGQFLSKQGLYSEGLQNLLNASKIFESLQLNAYVTLCHYEAANIQFNAKNYKQCIEEGYHVLEFEDKLGAEEMREYEFQRMSTFNTIGLANAQLRQYDLAIISYEKAEVIARKLNNDFWIGLINGNKGEVLRNLGREEEAIQSLTADYETSKRYKIWSSAGMSAIALSDIYFHRKDLQRTAQLIDSSRILFALDKDQLSVKKGYSIYLNKLALFKGATKDYQGGFDAMRRHVELRDSLSHEQENLNIAKVKATYDLDRKQTEIELLTKNNEVQQERIRSQKTLFIATLVVLILVLLLSLNLIYIFRRQRQVAKLLRQQRDEIEAKNAELEAQGSKLQENNQYIQSLNAKLEQKVAARTKELEETNHELDTFLYHSSHDIRRPITTLLGLDLVARQVTKDKEVVMLFEKVAETARSMDNMLYKMQMMYELNQPEHLLEPTDLSKIIRAATSYFKSEFDRAHMTNHLSMPETFTLFSNQPLLNIIFRNLIENAILFRKTQTGAEPFVDISVKFDGHEVEIAITDNGMGIDERYQPQVFDLYFRASQASKGNGLGLYLVKKSVQLLNGNITLMSDYGVGSTFTITLPVVQ